MKKKKKGTMGRENVFARDRLGLFLLLESSLNKKIEEDFGDVSFLCPDVRRGER